MVSPSNTDYLSEQVIRLSNDVFMLHKTTDQLGHDIAGATDALNDISQKVGELTEAVNALKFTYQQNRSGGDDDPVSKIETPGQLRREVRKGRR